MLVSQGSSVEVSQIRSQQVSFKKITLGQAFSGTLKKKTAPSTRYWSIFERNLVGLADFAGSKFQRMANWPRFDFFNETG